MGAVSVAALMALAAAASFAFITVAPAQQPPTKPAPAPTRPAPPPRTVTRSTPTVHTTTPTVRTTAPTVHTTTPIRPITPSQRTVIPSGPLGTPQSGRHTLPPGPLGPTQVGPSPTGLKLGPHGPLATPVHLPPGPNALPAVKPKFPVVTVNNRYFPIVKGQKFMHVGGHRRLFVPLGALGAILFEGSYWYPDGYVSIAGPYCAGYTPDGCELHWRMVDFDDGGGEPQCVQYCPLAGPPPAEVATLPPPPPLPEGTCQLTIFSNPNFAGTSAPAGDNQPNLSESGWQNAISSVQVQAGTWDFFSDDDYGGDTMRLTAGPYPMLTPDWDKKINSFMCVAPGPAA